MHNIAIKVKNMLNKYNTAIKNTLIFVAYVLALVFLFVAVINLNIVAITNDNIFTIDETIKLSDGFDCIMILGAGVRKDGSPTPMLNDRLTTGYEAFSEQKSTVIFLSGDSEEPDYTETVTMKNVLIENGVPYEAIVSDGYGLSTYESIWRAKNVYGYKKILIVSQGYHLNRAIYIARELGLNAYGLDAALQGYAKQPIYSFRESLARIKDMIYSEMLPTPEYTQSWEGFDE